MNHNRAGVRDLPAFTVTTGAKVEPNEVTGALTLTNTTYYIELGSSESVALVETALTGVHLKWNAAFAATITFETSNLPRYRHGRDSGPDDVTPWSATAGDWIPEDPTAAEVSVVGTGNSASGLSITAGGTNAGGATIHVGNLGTRRARLVVVCTTGGTLRAVANGKQGA